MSNLSALLQDAAHQLRELHPCEGDVQVASLQSQIAGDEYTITVLLTDDPRHPVHRRHWNGDAVAVNE